MQEQKDIKSVGVQQLAGGMKKCLFTPNTPKRAIHGEVVAPVH